MNANLRTAPEQDLISQLAQVRQALTSERESLMARVASIDEALGAAPHPKKTKPQTAKAPKTGSIKDAVIQAVTGSSLSMKEIQTLLSEHSPKSIESVVHSLVSAGLLKKDASSTPKRFSLNGVTEAK